MSGNRLHNLMTEKTTEPVSYTHLDVYKRQECDFNMGREKRNYWHRYSTYRTDADLIRQEAFTMDKENYSIIFSSLTGNTKKLADTIRAVLPAEDCCLLYTSGCAGGCRSWAG